MLSSSGKPIPPPPGLRRPPLSASGKPIPPPPGRGPNARPAPGGRPSGPSTGRPGGAGGGGPRGGARPGAPAGTGSGGYRGGGGGGAPGGGYRGPGAGTGTGAGPGGAGGARSGPAFGNRGRPGGRRPARRRRRNIEELEAQEITHYTPSNAPVPDGEIIVERGSTAQELGPKLNRSGADVVRFLFQQGEMVTTTQSLSDDMIELFAAELHATVRLVDPGEEKEAELQAKYFDDEEEDADLLRTRPPVVTVMGHVDHGKTLLLDRIRETNVVAGEAGGITQHIGAYQVDYQGQLITFIDTPGHEAFTAMRARGAEVTDIVILVVAADDGVMPQTVEALNHAKAADVPIIVALNKIDRDNADPNRVMQQLSEQGLVPEAWGGDTIMVEISALQNFGIDDLLEQVLLVAELEELVANPEGRGRGIVLEANLDPGKGPVATVIVQTGTLRVADSVVAGAAWGRVKALLDDSGDNVKEASPSMPVLLLGFDSVPAAGDEFRVTDKARTARDIAEQREQRFRAADQRRTSSAVGTGAKLEDIFEQIQRGETATLNLVLKADTQGSLEAVTESLRKLEREDVKLSFIHRAVGGITENDVTFAAASNATIIGFNVRPDRGARDLADVHDVEIRTYEIIYKLIEDIESAMVGMLAPEFEEVITGEAEVREIFRVPRVGAIAGCYVRHGVITRGSKVRFLRDGVVIWKGAITSLKRFKEDVREVHEGFECGIGLSNNQDLRDGDVIETFDEREIPRA
jgi:translation initiation factor IF-2